MDMYALEAQEKMSKCIENLRASLSTLRTGRASPAMLNGLNIDYYGEPTPLNQVSSITVPEPRQLLIKPYDRNDVKSIVEAISKSDLGLNPINEGTAVRLMIPALTEERRRDILGLFSSTQDNAFCLQALANYSKLYEDKSSKVDVLASIGSHFVANFGFDSNDSMQPLQDKTMPIDAKLSGKNDILQFKKIGNGSVYFSLDQTYTTDDLQSETNAGLTLKREISLKKSDHFELVTEDTPLKVGDIVKIDLFLIAPVNRSFVVIEDPVAGAFEPLNTDLATTSVSDVEAIKNKFDIHSFYNEMRDWNEFGFGFYHQELTHSKVRFYSEILNQGNYHLSYYAQVIAEGRFLVPAAYAEEMYDKNVFGISSHQKVNVK